MTHTEAQHVCQNYQTQVKAPMKLQTYLFILSSRLVFTHFQPQWIYGFYVQEL